MQTFLPYPEFTRSLTHLDSRRLGKQRVEAMQILNVLEGRTRAWSNHPAVAMWRGYEEALACYMNTAILEWISRGYNNTMKLRSVSDQLELPHWLGSNHFHNSHKSNLLRKDPMFYSKYNWDVPTNLPYVWPTGKEQANAPR